MIKFDLKNLNKENISIGDTDIKTTNEQLRGLFLKFKNKFKVKVWVESLVNIPKFYALYPYKKNTVKTYAIYIKKADISTHQYSLTYDEYKEIIFCFIKHLRIYLANGFVYRFTSGIGVLKVEKYKPKNLGINIPKTIKRVMREQSITSYTEARMWIKANKDQIAFEERKNLLLKGYKFKLSWYNKEEKIPFAYYWYMKLIRNNNANGGYQWFMKYYKDNPEAFSQVNLKERKGERKKVNT